MERKRNREERKKVKEQEAEAKRRTEEKKKKENERKDREKKKREFEEIQCRAYLSALQKQKGEETLQTVRMSQSWTMIQMIYLKL